VAWCCWDARNPKSAWRAAAVTALAIWTGLLAPGCGEDAPHAKAAQAKDVVFAASRGLTVTLAPGWQATRTSLTPHLVDPREVLTVATFPLRYRPTRCAHVAGSALEDLGPTDAFITLQERGTDAGSSWADFPPRPAHFGPQLGGASEASACVPSARFVDHWFGFTAGGRHFHVEVAFGPEASAATRDQAWAGLDSLQVDPSALPDWRSAG
jgi:hypothetical protein